MSVAGHTPTFCLRLNRRVVSLGLRRRLHWISDAVAGLLWPGSKKGLVVSGVDPSAAGIAAANAAYRTLNLWFGSACDPSYEAFGSYPLEVSLEMVEHVYAPRAYLSCLYNLLPPN